MVPSPLAVGLATVAQTVTGFVFYGPLFATRWLAAMRKDKNDPKYLTAPPEPGSYRFKLIASVTLDIVKATTTLYLVRYLRPHLPLPTVTVPLGLWLAAVAPAVAGEVIWEDRPPVLPTLRAANALAGSVVGAVVGTWVEGW